MKRVPLVPGSNWPFAPIFSATKGSGLVTILSSDRKISDGEKDVHTDIEMYGHRDVRTDKTDRLTLTDKRLTERQSRGT